MLRAPHSFNLPFLLVLRPKDTVNANLVFLFLFVLLFQLRHYCRVSQGCGISQGAAVGDVAQKPTHDLAAGGCEAAFDEVFFLGGAGDLS